MKTAAVLVTASAAIASTQASVISPLILGGTEVPIGEKTYTVGLRETLKSAAFCGGSLISPTHVLTAAHCARYTKYVSIGSHYQSGTTDGERIAIKKETIHPSFDEATYDYDFNIIELASPSKYTPVKLLTADTETFVGTTAVTQGWGSTSSGGSSSKVLLKVEVPVLSDKSCKAAGLTNVVTPAMFCAGGALNKDSCQGDSGGPIVLEQTSGDVLIGVVSWGDDCGVPGKPGVYAKVSVVQSWIQSLAPNATFI